MIEGAACGRPSLFNFNLMNLMIWAFLGVIILTLNTRRKIIIKSKLRQKDIPFVFLGTGLFIFITAKFANCRPGYILGALGAFMFLVLETTGGISKEGIIYRNSTGFFKTHLWSEIEVIEINRTYDIEVLYEVSGERWSIYFNSKRYENVLGILEENKVKFQ